jgi:hypothetical protein
MSKANFVTITSSFGAQDALNTNFTILKSYLDNDVLFRNNPLGEPNAMMHNLDMNGYSIINVGTIDTVSEQALPEDEYSYFWDVGQIPEAFIQLSQTAKTTLTATNQVAGGLYHARVKQDATGGTYAYWSSNYKFGSAGEPTNTLTANAEDIYTFRSNGSEMHCLGVAKGF